MQNAESDFYVIAREPGAENPSIPTWASTQDNPAQLASQLEITPTRKDLTEVPAAFQLFDVFSAAECERLIEISESLGYLEDAAVSLPRSVRHNDSFSWIIDDESNRLIWSRCQPLMADPQGFFSGNRALGLNARFRFYRYGPGDYFSAHTDGSWPGSRVVDGRLITNAYDDRWSQMSFLIFLSDDFEGGATQFYIDKNRSTAKPVSIRTPRGGVLAFAHGTHPLHCLHSSEPISKGRKYIIRSDLLFEL